MLYRIDSITSLVYYRERRGDISDESAAELLAVSNAVRAITNRAEAVTPDSAAERGSISPPLSDNATLPAPDHWTVRAVAWQLVAAVAATVAEYAVRLTVWAQDRSRSHRRRKAERRA